MPEALTFSGGSGDGFDRPCRPIIKYHWNHRKPQTGVKEYVTSLYWYTS